MNNAENTAKERELRALAGMLANLEEDAAPANLLPRIMARIEPKKVPAWRRFLRWFTEPRTLSVRPMWAAPLGAVAVALLVLALRVPTDTQAPTLVAENAAANQEVVFVFPAPQAGAVSLVGSFNGWTPQGYEMRYDEAKGGWYVSVPLAPGAYAYGFLVDGQLVSDPSAPLYQDDGFGNQNSMLFVGGSHEHTI